MRETSLTLLNTSILTAYGNYKYEPVELDQAKVLIRTFQADGKTVQSAIGHRSTADLCIERILHRAFVGTTTVFNLEDEEERWPMQVAESRIPPTIWHKAIAQEKFLETQEYQQRENKRWRGKSL